MGLYEIRIQRTRPPELVESNGTFDPESTLGQWREKRKLRSGLSGRFQSGSWARESSKKCIEQALGKD